MHNSNFCCCKVNNLILVTSDHETTVSVTVRSNTVGRTKYGVVIIDLDISNSVTFTKDTTVEVCISYLRRTNLFKVKEVSIDS